jgi:hypothetical protein
MLLGSQWGLLLLYLCRVMYFLAVRSGSGNILRLGETLIELDGYGGLVYHVLLLCIFISNSRDLLTDLWGATLCLTRNEMRNAGRYKYIDWKGRRPQGVLNNLINFFVSILSNARMAWDNYAFYMGFFGNSCEKLWINSHCKEAQRNQDDGVALEEVSTPLTIPKELKIIPTILRLPPLSYRAHHCPSRRCACRLKCAK